MTSSSIFRITSTTVDHGTCSVHDTSYVVVSTRYSVSFTYSLSKMFDRRKPVRQAFVEYCKEIGQRKVDVSFKYRGVEILKLDATLHTLHMPDFMSETEEASTIHLYVKNPDSNINTHSSLSSYVVFSHLLLFVTDLLPRNVTTTTTTK